jgi:hypothetical protein
MSAKAAAIYHAGAAGQMSLPQRTGIPGVFSTARNCIFHHVPNETHAGHHADRTSA